MKASSASSPPPSAVGGTLFTALLELFALALLAGVAFCGGGANDLYNESYIILRGGVYCNIKGQ